MRSLLVAIALAALPVGTSGQTWTLQGCSVFSCHRATITMIGVVGPYDQFMDLFLTSRYFGPYGGAPMRGAFEFSDGGGLYPPFGLALPGTYGEYFEFDDIMTAPPGWRPTVMFVEESIGPLGGYVTDDEIYSTTTGLVVTPEPATFLLLGTGLAGVMARRRRQSVRGNEVDNR